MVDLFLSGLEVEMRLAKENTSVAIPEITWFP
jgi:hypothetical protein